LIENLRPAAMSSLTLPTLLVLVVLCVVGQATALAYGYGGYGSYGSYGYGYPGVGYHGYHPSAYPAPAVSPYYHAHPLVHPNYPHGYLNGAQNPLIPPAIATCTNWWCKGHYVQHHLPIVAAPAVVAPAVVAPAAIAPVVGSVLPWASKKREAAKQKRSLGGSNQPETEEVSRQRKTLYPAGAAAYPAYPAAYHPAYQAAYHPAYQAAYHPPYPATYHPAPYPYHPAPYGYHGVPWGYHGVAACAPGTYAPVPSNPVLYKQCVHGQWMVRTCAGSTVWNQISHGCVMTGHHIFPHMQSLLPVAPVGYASKKRGAAETNQNMAQQPNQNMAQQPNQNMAGETKQNM